MDIYCLSKIYFPQTRLRRSIAGMNHIVLMIVAVMGQSVRAAKDYEDELGKAGRTLTAAAAETALSKFFPKIKLSAQLDFESFQSYSRIPDIRLCRLMQSNSLA